ncbi:DUF2807 domain-containing protein [Mucilaginibacter robiniae]|uniref:DUF2807 domain-containing protein n=1 Tax=Mucilaginibacter robiniae TaxID=2728022 RepID=A0A7L5E6P7_9SPHI|nr:head GIN domain-containing protein [Mucilaginibacter robiniae]QJD97444.1 DUF2807 domain-containing protein [Mucilaginibacter robiniae]
MKTSRYSLLILLTISLFSVTLMSCHRRGVKGSGHFVTQTHMVGDFHAIKISGAYKVNLKQDSSLNITITADDNLMKYIKTEVNNGELHLYNNKSINSSKDVVVTIGVRQLTAIKTEGAIELQSAGLINAQDLELQFAGASNVNLNLKANKLSTQGSGATEIYLTGQAASHDVHFAGMVKLQAYDLIINSYNLETSGASECELNVVKSLIVNSSGASQINYKGNPTAVNINKSGAASVKKIN